MRELILSGVALLLQTGIWFALGSLLLRLLKVRENAVQELVFGYLLYFALFEVLAVPMTLAFAPLSLLVKIWAAVLLALTVWSVILNGRGWCSRLKNIPTLMKGQWGFFVLGAAVIGVSFLYAALFTINTHDAAYYVGATNTAVYTDTMWRYDPYSGLPAKVFNPRYVFSAYPMHNAFWCSLLGVPALLQTKLVMAGMNVVVAYLLIYLIGKRLFENKTGPAVVMMLFTALLQMFSYTQYTPGAFLLTRGYEGKALLANISIPVVLYVSIWFWQECREKRLWVILFLASLSALTFSGSSIIFPVVLGAGMLPVMALKKRMGCIGLLAVCALPQMAYALVYFGTKAGYLLFPAW